ncbi:hypothetical protein [uncultured Desulfovibrio sp.]|uniref:hypothetical protein n=1 Tax=uncultured Desulfovibrio sp. TaxID=167968 RepID=UPI00262E29D9|nr:hypothetical protein [uncultured Desulfovibrio sp.]
MTDIELFLERKTIRRIPPHARISRAQCGVNILSGNFGYRVTCPERHLAVFEGKALSPGSAGTLSLTHKNRQNKRIWRSQP